MKTAVIAGASGLVGSLVLKELLESNEIKEVIAIVRRPLQIQNAKLREVTITDFSELADKALELKGELYFCCLGTTIKKAGSQEAFRKIDHDSILYFGRIAEAHRCEAFMLISANGANPRSPIFYSKVKGETEVRLGEMRLGHLHIYRPGLLMGNRIETRTAESFAISTFQFLRPIIPGFYYRAWTTDVHHLARRMVKDSLRITASTPPIRTIESASI